jgi:hypothetical protein
MGFLATVVEFLRSSDQGTPTPEIKFDRGGEDTGTAFHFAPPGTDAQPLAADVAYLGDDIGAGIAQALGYQDPKNAGVAGAGEHRLYARAAGGTLVGEIWLKADGSILVRSVLAGSSAELGADGAISLANAAGGLAIDAAGNVTAKTPLGTFGAGTHMHLSPFGPTAGPIPGT